MRRLDGAFSDSSLAGQMATSQELQFGSRAIEGRVAFDGRALVEFAIAYGLIALAVWTPRPWQQGVSLMALAWVLITTWLSFDSWRAMGFRVMGFWRATWVLGVALVLAAMAIALAAWLQTLHVPSFPVLFVQRYWAYTIWAFLQEFLLLNFFLLRLLRLLPSRNAAAMVASTLFALVHLPNPVLTPLTLIWGYAACLIFLNYRNIYVPAMAHALLGICIAVTIPAPVDHNMRVGLGYLTYREHRHPQRSQIDHTVSTSVWAIADEPMRRC
jgi:membrane protease YdiL (CAAX protease family)